MSRLVANLTVWDGLLLVAVAVMATAIAYIHDPRPMLMVMRVAQEHFHLGVGASLAFGWIAFLALLLPLNRDVWSRNAESGPDCREAGRAC